MSEERTYVDASQTALLEEFKRHIRMTTDDMDADLLLTLKAAAHSAEHHIGKVILRSRFVVTCPFVPTVTLKSPDPTVLGLVVDGQAVEGYTLDGRQLNVPQNVTGGTTMTITYEVGYRQIPPDIKKAIFLHATSLFNNPANSVQLLTTASQILLRPYRSWGLD